jgi:hypothetical protein
VSLTQDQAGELQACFQTFDSDGDGRLTAEECAMAMRALGTVVVLPYFARLSLLLSSMSLHCCFVFFFRWLGYDLPTNQVGQCDMNQFMGLAQQHIVIVDRQRTILSCDLDM